MAFKLVMAEGPTQSGELRCEQPPGPGHDCAGHSDVVSSVMVRLLLDVLYAVGHRYLG